MLQLRGRCHLLVLLEHGLLYDRVPEGALAQGAQEEVQERKNRSCRLRQKSDRYKMLRLERRKSDCKIILNIPNKQA